MFEKVKHINRRYLLQTRRMATMAAALGAIGVGLLVFVFVPQVQSIFELLDDKSKADKQVATLGKKVAQLQVFPQSQLLAQADEINSVLPSKKPLLELLTSYNQIARQVNVSFADVSLSPGKISTEAATLSKSAKRSKSKSTGSRKKTDYEEIEIEITVIGPLSNVQRFLDAIETVAPVTTVTKMTLNEKKAIIRQDEDQLEEKIYEAKLVTTTYFFTKSVTATINSPVPELTADQNKVMAEVGTFTIPNISEQTRITGGGLQDLFGIDDNQFDFN
jgi:hypothetical protein